MITRRALITAPVLETLSLQSFGRPSERDDARGPWRRDVSSLTRPAPPAPAVAAGYTRPALLDDFSGDTVASGAGGTYNWYPYNPYGGAVLEPGQYEVADSCLVIKNDVSGYSSGLTTLNSLAPTCSRPGAIQRNLGRGVVFQYGYFECRMKFDSALSPRTAKGQSWPAFWSNGLKGPQQQSKTYPELDFVEAYPVASRPYVSIACTMHEWTRGWKPDGAPSGQNRTVFNHNNTIGTPPLFHMNDFNVYGCLWTPRLVQWFVNDQLVSSAPVGRGTDFPSTELDEMYLVLGTGKNWPMVVDYVGVWQ